MVYVGKKFKNKDRIIYSQLIKHLFLSQRFYKEAFEFLIEAIRANIVVKRYTQQLAFQTIFLIIENKKNVTNVTNQEAEIYLNEIIRFVKQKDISLRRCFAVKISQYYQRSIINKNKVQFSYENSVNRIPVSTL